MSFFPRRVLPVALGLALAGCGQSFAGSGGASPVFPADPQPTPSGNAAQPSAARLADLSKGMSSAARQALEQLLRTKDIDGLSKISEADARQTFGGMPANVRDEIRAKWEALSDAQRAVLMRDVKELAASRAKDIVRASIAPIVKPVGSAATDSDAMVSRATRILGKMRAYTQRLIAKLTGSTAPNGETAGGGGVPEEKN